jgi:hypothetical protein
MSKAWEATYYVAECGPAWHGTPGAVEWLTKTITAIAAKPASTFSRSLICLSVRF